MQSATTGDLIEQVNSLHRAGRLSEAVAVCRELLRRKPRDAGLANLLARLRFAQGQWDEAARQAEKACQIEPSNAAYRFHRALTLIQLGRHQDAIEALRSVVSIDREFPHALSILLKLSLEACDWQNFDRCIADLMEVGGSAHALVDPGLLVEVFDDPAMHLAAARNTLSDATAAYRRQIPPTKFFHDRLRKRDKIRIGYFSADFRNHAVTHLLTELIEVHDRTRFEVIGVSIGPDDGSSYRLRVKEAFDRFVDTLDWPIHEFSRRLRELDLDILIDLMGHTKLNQLAILESRPAPILVNYLGYPGTTGASFIDYLIVDRFIAPVDQQAYYSERLVQLPDYYVVNGRNRVAAEFPLTRAACGLPENCFVFCAFNRPEKLMPPVFRSWMNLLRAVSDSVLWLLSHSDAMEANIRKEATKCGVDASRLIFASKVPLPDHIARLPLADLFLDTFPYNAHTTACDALWVGLPIVTRAGSSFASRVCGSALSTVGLAELITYSAEEYEALALHLARDRESLHALRERIHNARDTSPLFDSNRYCRHIESAYEVMVDVWRSGETPRPFAIAANG